MSFPDESFFINFVIAVTNDAKFDSKAYKISSEVLSAEQLRREAIEIWNINQRSGNENGKNKRIKAYEYSRAVYFCISEQHRRISKRVTASRLKL